MSAPYTVTPEGRLQLTFRMPQYWMPGSMEQCIMDFFDWEHFGHRHRGLLGHARLLSRGPRHFEMEMPNEVLGLKLPDLVLRGEYSPPARLDMIAVKGTFRGSRVNSECWSVGGRTFVEETHILEVDDTPFFRGMLTALPFALPIAKILLLLRPRKVREQDFVAFGHMAQNYVNDRYIANGVLMRFPPGGAQERMMRLSPVAISEGCDDCGRHEMGFEHRGKVRCAICDFFAYYSTPEYEIIQEGAEVRAVRRETAVAQLPTAAAVA